MQLLLDCIKLQKDQGLFKTKRKLTANIKDDAEAAKELTELLLAILSESIDRDIPIDKIFAKLHVNLVKRQPISPTFYEDIIKEYRNIEPLKHIRQNTKGISVLQHIHQHYQRLNEEAKQVNKG